MKEIEAVEGGKEAKAFKKAGDAPETHCFTVEAAGSNRAVSLRAESQAGAVCV